MRNLRRRRQTWYQPSFPSIASRQLPVRLRVMTNISIRSDLWSETVIVLTLDYSPNAFMARNISQHRRVTADAVKIRVTYPRILELDEDFAFSRSWHRAIALDPHLCGDRSTCGWDNSSDLNWGDWGDRHLAASMNLRDRVLEKVWISTRTLGLNTSVVETWFR